MVAVIAVVISTHFMLQDKNHILTIRHALLAPEDELIQSMIVEASDPAQPFRAASQWPARTMLATKRDVLPLPPAIDDEKEMLKAIQSLTHIAFDPANEKYKPLANALAGFTAYTETLALFKAGVIVKVTDNKVELSTQQRLALEEKNKKEQNETEGKDQ